MIGSVSKVYLELLADTKAFSNPSLKNLAKDIKDVEGGSDKSAAAIKKLLDKAMVLSKTPFMNTTALKAAATIIDSLATKIKTLQGDLKSYAGPADGLTERKKELALRVKLLKDYEVAYRNSSQRLVQLEKDRIRLMNQAYAFAAKTTFSGDMRNQFYEVANRLGNVNVGTQVGQKNMLLATRQYNDLSASIAKHRAEMGSLAKAYEKFKLVFGRVVDALASFYIINTIQTLVVGFAKSLIMSNAIMETSEARLKSLVVTSAKFEKIQKNLQKLTIETPFDYKQILEASALARAFGVDIERNMKSIADWASATNKDLTETATAFGKIVNYSPRTALLLSTRGFSKPLFDSYIAMYKDRELALRKMIEDTYSGMAAKISNTFQGMLTNLNDVWMFISKKMGEPIFDKLNNSLSMFFYFLKSVNNEWSGFLKFIGQIISFSASFTTMFGLSIAVKYLITAIPKMSKAMAEFMGIAKFGFASYGPILGSIMASIGAVTNALSLRSVVSQINEKESVGTGGMSLRERLEQERSLLDLYEKRLGILKESFNNYYNDISLTERRIAQTKEYVALLELQVREQQRVNAGIIAKGEIAENYQMSKLVEELGLRKELLDVVQQLDKYALGLELISPHRKESTLDTMSRLDDIAFTKSKSTYLQAISGKITPEKAMADLKKQLLEYSVNAKAAGNITQDVVKFIEGFNEALKEMSGILEKDGKKALVDYIDYLTQINEMIERTKSLQSGEVVKRADLDAKGLTVKNMLLENNFKLSDNILKIQEELAKGYWKESAGKDNKLINEHNEAIRNKIKLLNDYQVMAISYNDKRIKDAEKELDSLNKYNEKVRDIKQSYESLSNKINTDKFSHATTAQLQKALDNVRGFQTVNRAKALITTGDERINVEQRYIKQLNLEYDLINKSEAKAGTFGQAYLSVYENLVDESGKLHGKLAQISMDFLGDASKGILNELLFGTTSKDLDSQISDLRFELIKIQGEKAGVKFVEDTEVTALAKINELEAKRANVILPILEKSLQSVTEKMSDIIFGEIAQRAMKPFIENALAEKMSATEKFSNKVKEANSMLTEIPTVGLTLWLGYLQTISNTYGEILAKIMSINTAMMAQQGLNPGDAGLLKFPMPDQTPFNWTPGPSEPRKNRMGNINIVPKSGGGSQVNQVVFNGDVYGMDDFKKKVGQANKELAGRMVK